MLNHHTVYYCVVTALCWWLCWCCSVCVCVCVNVCVCVRACMRATPHECVLHMYTIRKYVYMYVRASHIAETITIEA